uniref:Uncharacterized protein n=1 Tax=Oryza brachyantha TaxID=4533 RepID=J3N051_ORYBR
MVCAAVLCWKIENIDSSYVKATATHTICTAKSKTAGVLEEIAKLFQSFQVD